MIRAISIATGKPWYKIYAGLSVQGRFMCGWWNFNEIWSDYLLYLGFSRHGHKLHGATIQKLKQL